MPEKKDDRLAILRRRVAKVPGEPGVYRWLGKDRSVLYVGKAKNLKNRMMSYVQEGPKRSAWNEIMVRQIEDFEVSVVRSELEAFILEANLIKELKPKYNIMLKDDKGYVYVRISMHEPYPRVEIVRRIGDDAAKYFGPFTSGVKNTEYALQMLDAILHFRVCTHSLDLLNQGKTLPGTPCLDQQIGRCAGLCIGTLSNEEYRSRIAEVERFFRGNFSSMKQRTEEAMKDAAKNQKFERAAKLRDVLRFIEGLESKQVISDTSGEDADIFGIALLQGKTHVVLLKQRDGKIIDQVSFALKGGAENASEALEQFLPQYYSNTRDIPSSIILGESLLEASSLTVWLKELRGTNVTILIPERGKKSKLLLMAERNALEKVEQQFAAWEAEHKKVEGALSELATLLNLAEPPRRIEGYDISHLGGTATVGSMVVMVNGKPKREHYRSFNMQTVKEGVVDDYKSLAETLRRRLRYLSYGQEKNVLLTEQGIAIGKAKKSDEAAILQVLQAASLSTNDVSYKNFFVARNNEKIIACARLFQYPDAVTELKSLWVDEPSRGSRLGHILIRTMLKTVKKGKVYVTNHPDLEQYYAELGFRHVATPPETIQKSLALWHAEHPQEQSKRMTMVYIVKDHAPDESFLSPPDLLLIDGGKGQLGAVVDVLKEFQLNIPVAGLAKREEEIFLPGNPVSLAVPEGSEARFLLQRLRDEAHRFANDRRERRLTATMIASKLDDVPSIGEATKMMLLKKFGSADTVLQATDEELRTVLSDVQLRSLREKFPRVL